VPRKAIVATCASSKAAPGTWDRLRELQNAGTLRAFPTGHLDAPVIHYVMRSLLLTRISHQLSAAVPDPGMSTALRSVGLLDVLSSMRTVAYACGAIGRAP